MKKKPKKTPKKQVKKRNKKNIISENDFISQLSDKELLEVLNSDLESEIKKKRNKKNKINKKPKKPKGVKKKAKKRVIGGIGRKKKIKIKKNKLKDFIFEIISKYKSGKLLSGVYQAINQSLANEVQDAILEKGLRYFIFFKKTVREIKDFDLVNLRSFTFSFMDWFIKLAVDLGHVESPYVLWDFFIEEKNNFRILFLPPMMHPDQLKFEVYEKEFKFKLSDISTKF